MLISIVGKSGAGKSTIISKLREMNSRVRHLDIDKIGHYVNDIPSVQKKLMEAFGPDIIINNKVNRKALAKIVFTSKEAMQLLTDITWPDMEKMIDSYINENKDTVVILDWQLLPKTKFFWESDLRILVTAPYEIREERVMKRDKITKEKFLERESSSLDFDLDDFDEVINNTGNIESEVKKVYEKNIISG